MKPGLYMAIDQYGHTFHGLKYPRKDLMEHLRYRSARKMYADYEKDGRTYHVGYVVGPHWCTVYAVEPVCIPVNVECEESEE